MPHVDETASTRRRQDRNGGKRHYESRTVASYAYKRANWLVLRIFGCRWVQLVSSEVAGQVPDCVFPLIGAEVQPLVLAGEAVAPVLVEVVVADHGAQ